MLQYIHSHYMGQSLLISGGQLTAMSLSTKAHFGLSQGSRVKGDTICVVPDFSSDPMEDDFDLNKSYPCTQRSMYKKSRLALQNRYFPGFVRGKV